jgi:thiol-disulfide isomerase/thioredoxin
MKRIVIIAVVLVLIIGGAVATLALLRPSTPDALPAPAPTRSEVATEQPADEESASVAGSYVDYSDTAIADAEGTRLLFFHAPWCPQCRSIDSDIVADGVPDGVTIIKVDYDSHQDLRQQYGVTLQTTFVEVDASGNALQSFVAYDTPSLQAVVDAML